MSDSRTDCCAEPAGGRGRRQDLLTSTHGGPLSAFNLAFKLVTSTDCGPAAPGGPTGPRLGAAPGLAIWPLRLPGAPRRDGDPVPGLLPSHNSALSRGKLHTTPLTHWKCTCGGLTVLTGPGHRPQLSPPRRQSLETGS